MNEMTVEAKVENIPAITAWIDEELEKVGCSIKAQMQIDVAIDELFSNIAYYAYAPDTGEATVRFGFDPASRTATITFIDSGVPYDPLAKEDPDVTLSADERSIGGLGIYLTKKFMDDVSYVYKDGKNTLTLVKDIS